MVVSIRWFLYLVDRKALKQPRVAILSTIYDIDHEIVPGEYATRTAQTYDESLISVVIRSHRTLIACCTVPVNLCGYF